MLNSLFRRAGKHAVRKAARPGGFLDFRYGFELMRDHGVPVGSKVVALGCGVCLTTLLIVLEVPLEGVAGLFLPVVGLVTDSMVDGLELIVLPIVFACLILPHLKMRSSGS
ncbi:MAG TPA: hypothetical protein VMI31_12575 [Fimbriimonadaceae bacterium]|nr:hypothetical protein [Fimbriimonadaceae bacterium]